MRRGAVTLLVCAGCAVSQPTPAIPTKSAQRPKESSVASVVVSQEPAAARRESIKGKVRLAGKAPIRPQQAPHTCDSHKAGNVTCELWCVGTDGALANVVMTLRNHPAPPAAPPVEPIQIIQWCTFRQPRVAVVQVGQPLVFLNGERVLHNLHLVPRKNPEINRGLPREGDSVTMTFTDAEPGVELKCDVHPWETAWVHVVDHPYFAVTGTDGEYEIKGLSPGAYELVAWHERFRTAPLVAEVHVDASKTTIVDFTFEGMRR